VTAVVLRAGRPGRTIHSLDERGFIRDWLVSPGWGTPCDDLAQVLESTGSPWGSDGRWVLTNGPDVAPLKEKLYRRHPLLLTQPLPDVVEGGAVEWIRSAGDVAGPGVWERFHTGSDGLVDWSRFCYTPEYRYAVAATAVEVDQAEYRTLHVASTGPVAVFVGGELVLEADSFGYMEPNLHLAHVRLNSGVTPIHVVTWQVAFRECRHVFSLRVQGLPVSVVIPLPGVDEHRSRLAEQLLDSIAVGPWAARDGLVHIDGPEGLGLAVTVNDHAPRSVRLTDGSAVIDLAATDGKTDREAPAKGAASMLRTGEAQLTIRVDDPSVPVYRAFRVATLPKRRRPEPVGAPNDWRDELLAHCAGHDPDTARTLARHALNPESEVEPEDLATALQMVHGRYDCADFEAVGLVTAWHRIPEANWRAGDRDRVKDALTGFKYWIDQPGLDAMCYFTENHQMVWHTAEMLVGELFADATFANTGWTGAQHAQHAQPMVLEWIHRKLVGGFSEFDSNAYLAINCLALVSIVEFAQSTRIRQGAEALLDKTLLTLATNSWRGVHGAAHGRSYTHTLRSGRFEETAPIMWLLFGVGALNGATLPAAALATAEHYRVPPVVRALAANCPEQWYGRQVYKGEYRLNHDLLTRAYGSDLRVWRTPDAMLSSVQDYRSGLPGLQEHIWGATLDSEIQVFATHPATSGIGPSARPNGWAGQRVLPRVHQDRDTLLVLHRIPAGDWLGTTHLWFPAELFDEWRPHGAWLAGRYSNGYVAVATRGGFRPQRTGDDARQCWWPVGPGREYVATVGRAATSGSFDDFVSALTEPFFGSAALEPEVGWRTPDGRELALTWDGPFTVNGHAAGLAANGLPEVPLHLDNPATRQRFGDDQLIVEWGGERLVLNYRTSSRTEPPSRVVSLHHVNGGVDGR
jgi:hypothetical protein